MGKGFLGKLIRSMLLALILAGLFSAVLVFGMKLLKGRFLPSETNGVMEPLGNSSTLTEADRVAKPLPDVVIGLVYVTDEAGDLSGCFYTVLDCLEVRLDFYMVPTDTRLQLSTELYGELVTKNTKLAQINTLEGMYRCFTAKEAPECVQKALKEAVGVTADYYTVMPEASYRSIFKEDAHTYAYDSFLQEDIQEQIIATGSMKAYLTGVWEQCECNVSWESRMYYLETYENLTNLRVSCRMIAGERRNNGYVLKGSGL